MIEQTIRDIRANLPDCEIIIMLDGIRPEQEDRRGAYEEYKRRLLWLAHHTWHNVLPIIFDEHMHQAAMTREALKSGCHSDDLLRRARCADHARPRL